MRVILFLCALLCFPILAKAQENSLLNRNTESTYVFDTNAWGYNFNMGAQFSQISKLNKMLESEGIPEVKSIFTTFGVGLNRKINNHLLFIDLNIAINDREDDRNNIKTSAYGFGLGINYGYKIRTNHFDLFPYLGINGNTMIINIQELPSGDVDFNNQLNNRTVSRLENDVFAIQPGVRILIPSDNDIFFTGITIGYNIPFHRRWFVGDHRTVNAPNLNIGGLMIGVEILFLVEQFKI